MCLSDTNLVDCLKVHCAPGLAILLGNHDHPGAPGVWGVNLNFLQHTEGNIIVQPLLHLALPVKRYWSSLVDCHGLGIGIDIQLHGWRVGDEGQSLVLTTVKS